MEWLIMLILMVIVAAAILWPLLRGSGSVAAPPSPVPVQPPGGKVALTAIKELEFDYATGKLAEDDYKVLRARYEAKAVAALAQRPAPPAEDVTARLEAEIRAARGRRFCASCGTPLPTGARFCPACGAAAAEGRT